ncbi:MFS transporter [Desulfosarcina alkanivorans]|uniref:MFS transporter n=1 Tax=Desulfosarcina alkanivorans TaxID=571177 RepID=A0A5K7YPZ2_9BACT|nr:MFS transporter [Desulfosarcina alkanivorans]BBO71326.1 MFS transporter [Desulfosarcina alkanivorans]
MKRYRILFAAVAMQMCLGATYAWSIFVLPLKQTTGILQGTAQLPFSLFYFAFPATMIVTGVLLPRIGPRRCAVAGGLLFGGGWIMAAMGHFHFAFTIVGIGLVAGIGVGFAYIVPIATCVRWFPRQKGLVTGVAVAGFGGGAALVSHAADTLMAAVGMSPFNAFGVLGTIFLLLVALAGSLMENPPGSSAEVPQPIPVIALLKERSFAVLYLAMFAGLAAGFAVNANMKELYGDAGVQAGVRAVAAFALANAAGRITWGWIFDRGRSALILQANLLLQAGLLMLHGPILRSDSGLIAFAVLSGFNYGGILVLYASAAAERWGSERLGQIYGWLFSANIPAAAAPIVAGVAFDRMGSFTPVLWGIGGLMAAGALALGKGLRLDCPDEVNSDLNRSVKCNPTQTN